MRAPQVEEPALSLSKGPAVACRCLSFCLSFRTLSVVERGRNLLLAIAIAYLSPSTKNRVIRTPQTLPSSNRMEHRKLDTIGPPQHQTVPSENFRGESQPVPRLWKYPANS